MQMLRYCSKELEVLSKKQIYVTFRPFKANLEDDVTMSPSVYNFSWDLCGATHPSLYCSITGEHYMEQKIVFLVP